MKNGKNNPASTDLLSFSESGSGPPLLLVHGMMVTGEMFESVIADFSKRHRVIIPDLRGHGKSRTLPLPYTVAQLASDLSHLLNHLGIATTDVLGYSQGGAIAHQLALDHPAQCRRLILVCTYAFNMASIREKIEGHLVPLLIRTLGMRRFAKFVIALGLGRVNKTRAVRVVDLIADQDPNLMTSTWKEAMAFDSRQRLVEIKCATLVVAAADDQAVPIHHANMLHDGIKGSRLVIIKDADHALIWTRPSDLVRVVEEFLEA